MLRHLILFQLHLRVEAALAFNSTKPIYTEATHRTFARINMHFHKWEQTHAHLNCYRYLVVSVCGSTSI